MDPISEWLIDNAMSARSLAELLEGVCGRLRADGVPVVRANLSLAVIDPSFRARTTTWLASKPAADAVIPHDRDLQAFETSPIGTMYIGRQTIRHWVIGDADRRAFPLFDEIARCGMSDYFALLHPFANAEFGGLRGVAFTVASDRPGGLTEAERDRIVAISRVLAPIVYRIMLGDIAISLLDVYVGRPASRRILSGQVRRGSGEPIEAVVLVADLVGFTPVAESARSDLIERLDEHFEAMAAPVVERGGSVLKFMGDAVLAVFAIDEGMSKRDACRLALEAARDAIARNAAVNRAREGERPLHLDVALTCGKVFYGNVGAPGRLDFTAIGPAVNAAARIEALSDLLGRNLLISEDVAAELEAPLVSLGRHRLRGIGAEREIFTPAENVGERGKH